METVRIGLLGCGSWGRNLLRECCQLGARVFVVDPDERARSHAKTLGAEAVFATMSDLPLVDGLLVSTPASIHYDAISSLLESGVPIFSEKPFTLDLDQAKDLVHRGNGRIFVLHVWRHHAGVAAIQELYRRRDLGNARWLRTTRTNWTSPRTDCDPVWTLLPHDLSIILEVTGELPPLISAHAELSQHGPCGLVAILRSTFPCVIEVSTRYADRRREIRLHCDAGVAELSPDGNSVHVHQGDDRSPVPQTRIIPLGAEPALTREISAVIDFLRGGPPPASSADDALLIATRMHEIRRMAGI